MLLNLPPPVTNSHTSDPPIVSRPSTKTRTKAVQILSPLFVGVSVQEVLSEGPLSGRSCTGWFLSVPPSVRIHLLQQKVKHQFKFHVSYVR